MAIIVPPFQLARNNRIRQANSRITLPNFANCQQVMSTPFAATLVANASTITNPLWWPSASTDVNNNINASATQISSSYFSLSGAGGFVAGTVNPNPLFIQPTSVNYGGGTLAYNTQRVVFHHYGSEIEIFFKGTTSELAVKIDDQYLSLLPITIPNDGNGYHYYMNFGSVGVRRIELLAADTFNFGGVYTNQTDMIAPAPLRGPRCIILGDSFTEGTGSLKPFSYVQYFSDYMGWDDVWASGVGATGYLTTNGSRGTLRSRVAGDIIAFNPDVVIVAGGYNDTGSTASAVQAEALLLYKQILQGLPGVTLIVCASFKSTGAAANALIRYQIDAALKSAAASVGAIFIDPNEQVLPPNYVPDVQALATSNTAGGTTVVFPNLPVVMGTYKWVDGTKFLVKSASFGGSNWTATIDSNLQTSHTAGELMTQVGSSYLTGVGNTSSLTGFGSCDLLVTSDATHPSPEGHKVLGYLMASQVMAALAPN